MWYGVLWSRPVPFHYRSSNGSNRIQLGGCVMGKSVSVKVKTSVLVEALEQAMIDRKRKFEDSQKAQAEYDKQVKAREAKIAKLIESGKGTIEGNHCESWRDRSDGMVAVNVLLLIPESSLPKKQESPQVYAEWEYNRECEEISNAIRILKMTEQEFVNASTLSSVSKFL